MPVRHVLIADDHRLFADGLSRLLREGGYSVSIVNALHEVEAIVVDGKPDVVLLDLAFGHDSALPLLRTLRREHPQLPIIVVSAMEERVIIDSVLATGASYIAKSRASTDLRAALETVLAGGQVPRPHLNPLVGKFGARRIGTIQFTDQQIAVLAQLRDGDSNGEIAIALGRSIKSIEHHLAGIRQKIGLTTRGQLIRWAREHASELGDDPVHPPG